MARPDKAAAVAEITERFREAEAAILTEYRGLHVSDLAEVRTALRGANAEYKVLKNTLARIAAKEVGIEQAFSDMLVGPTAIVFVKDDVAAAAKALDEVARTYPVLIVKGGVMQGRTFGADQAKALAKLEPREVQLAKIAGLMNQPAQSVANVLSALLRNFGSMLAQVVEKKESGELPSGSGNGAATAETPAEAAPGTPAEVPGEPAGTPGGGEGESTSDEEAPAPGDPEEQPSSETEEPTASADAGEVADLPEAQEQAEAAPESEEAANEDVTEESK